MYSSFSLQPASTLEKPVTLALSPADVYYYADYVPLALICDVAESLVGGGDGVIYTFYVGDTHHYTGPKYYTLVSFAEAGSYTFTCKVELPSEVSFTSANVTILVEGEYMGFRIDHYIC